jgi:hypothetical protein
VYFNEATGGTNPLLSSSIYINCFTKIHPRCFPFSSSTLFHGRARPFGGWWPFVQKSYFPT